MNTLSLLDFVPLGLNVSSRFVADCVTVILFIFAPSLAEIVNPPFFILNPLPLFALIPDVDFGVSVITPDVIAPDVILANSAPSIVAFSLSELLVLSFPAFELVLAITLAVLDMMFVLLTEAMQ